MVIAGSYPVMVSGGPGSLFTTITDVLYGGVTYQLGGRSSTIEAAVPAQGILEGRGQRTRSAVSGGFRLV